MEAATEKKKRGRPSVDARDGSDLVEVIANYDTQMKTHRSHVNEYYRLEAVDFLRNHLSELPHACKLIVPYKDSYIPRKTGLAVLEQLGRMILQDGYSDDDVLTVANVATTLLSEHGFKVKEVERYMRHGRTTGEWGGK